MPKIKNINIFPKDNIVTESDYVIGTDGDNNGKTKNYSVLAIAKFVSEYIGSESLNLNNIPEFNTENEAYLALGAGRFFRWAEDNSDGVASPKATQLGITQGEIVFNNPPLVNAGNDKTITLPTDSTSTLATAVDGDGNVIEINWMQINGGNSATITESDTLTPTFSNLIEGVYTFKITATDNSGASSSDIIQVTVLEEPNGDPIADAGSDKTITLPTNSVSISANATDGDGVITTILWEQISGVAVNIQNGNTLNPTFSNFIQEGDYTFRMSVTDDDGASANDVMSVNVNPIPNNAPTIDGGGNKTITLPNNSVSVNAIANDTDGTITSVNWVQISGANNATITNHDTLTPTFSNLVEGTYVFRIAVTDEDNDTSTDTITVEVEAEQIITYSNIEISESFTRNNCTGSDLGSQVTYTVIENTYQSSVSQADADAKAQADIDLNGQSYANSNGTCTNNSISWDGLILVNSCGQTTGVNDNKFGIIGDGTVGNTTVTDPDALPNQGVFGSNPNKWYRLTKNYVNGYMSDIFNQTHHSQEISDFIVEISLTGQVLDVIYCDE